MEFDIESSLWCYACNRGYDGTWTYSIYIDHNEVEMVTWECGVCGLADGRVLSTPDPDDVLRYPDTDT